MRYASNLLFITTLLSAGLAMATVNLPKPNPYLASKVLAITHIDMGQTDSYPYSLPQGTFNINLDQMPHANGGPVNIITLASSSADYMWGVSSNGVTYIYSANGNWQEVAHIEVPGVKYFDAEVNKKALGKLFTNEKQVINVVKNIYGVDGLERLSGGIYSVVDKDNILYATYANKVFAFALVDNDNPSKGLQILRSLDFKNVSDNDMSRGLSLTYDGKLIMLGMRSIIVMNRDFSGSASKVKLPKNEAISNSVAVDENNGIYVASNKTMYKMVWTGNKLSQDAADGAWSSAYDIGDQPPVVKFGNGTGSTPTLMGYDNDADKLVVITDGANRMKLVAFWRDAIPENFKQVPGTKTRRIAGQIQVTCGFKKIPKFIQSEQSVVVNGYGAFVVNNIGTQGNKDLLVGVLALGSVYPPPKGMERFEWDPGKHAWRSVWANSDVVSTSMVPVVSIPGNMVFVNGYTKQDGWEVTGLDWSTGKVVHRTIFGQTNYGNGAYALLEIYPDNNLIFNSVGGPFRIQYK